MKALKLVAAYVGRTPDLRSVWLETDADDIDFAGVPLGAAINGILAAIRSHLC